MLSVVLLGTGNVAHHLFHAFSKSKDIAVHQVYGRNSEALKDFEPKVSTTTSIAKIAEADMYILAVSDSSVTEVSKTLRGKKGTVVHTSGSVPMDAIKSKQRGVFYPLQTFTKGNEVDFREIPICIEAEGEENRLLLETLGKSISNHVYRISSAQRKKLHLCAVLVNNYPNHLYHMAHEICAENKIPFHLLFPLILETVNKIRHLSPKEAQTGPARRNDIVTMQQHISQLQDPLQQKIYQLLSESIKALYEKEL
ncbi:DUF2520 domain-containing protein [Flavobacteriaceae bacterium GF1]